MKHTMTAEEVGAILNLLQDAECRAFYAATDDPDKERRELGKVLDRHIRNAIEHAAYCIKWLEEKEEPHE